MNEAKPTPKPLRDALDQLEKLWEDAIDALESLVSPAPQPVPIPIRGGRRDR